MIFHRVSPAQQAIVNAMSFESCKQAVENDAQMGCLPGMVAGPYCRPFEGMGASFWYPCDCLTACDDKAYYRHGEMPRPIRPRSYTSYAVLERMLVGDWLDRIVLVDGLNRPADGSDPTPFRSCMDWHEDDIMKVFGFDKTSYMRRFARHSLCIGVWNRHMASLRAEWLMALYPGKTFILLGSSVGDAFSRPYSSHLTVTIPVLTDPVWHTPGAYAMARDAILNVCPQLKSGIKPLLSGDTKL